jgi:hypothetical protein
MSSVTYETQIEGELEHVLRETLKASDSPLTSNQVLRQLMGPFKRSREELEETLESLVERGQVHRLGKYRGSERYWDRRPEEYARTVMTEKLRERPMTRSELRRAIEKPLKIVPKTRRDEILRELVQSGAVKELPPFIGARSKRLSSQPLDPGDYVEHALKKVCNQLAKNGISEQQIRGAALEYLGSAALPLDLELLEPVKEFEPPSELGADVKDLVLARAMEIDVGALVPLVEFRQGLDFQDRGEVDQAIWDLVRNELVAVEKHHHPISMSGQEREASLRDESGNFYHAISRRNR